MGGFLNNHCPVVDKHFTDQSSHQFRTISRYKKEMTATVFTVDETGVPGENYRPSTSH
jgi:hypothetical protein